MIARLRIRDQGTLVHKFDSAVEIVEKNRFIDLLLGEGLHLQHAFGDNSEVSLMTQDEFMDVRT